MDGLSRLAYTEHLPDEKAATTVVFISRARAFFAAHGIHSEVERYQRILAEELFYIRPWTSEEKWARAIVVWNIRHDYHRPRIAAGNRPSASCLHVSVTNVMAGNI